MFFSSHFEEYKRGCFISDLKKVIFFIKVLVFVERCKELDVNWRPYCKIVLNIHFQNSQIFLQAMCVLGSQSDSESSKCYLLTKIILDIEYHI